MDNKAETIPKCEKREIATLTFPRTTCIKWAVLYAGKFYNFLINKYQLMTDWTDND